MKKIKKKVVHKKSTFGPFDIIQFDSVGEAIEFYQDESMVLCYINRAIMVSQLSIARIMSVKGASVDEVHNALESHRPREVSSFRRLGQKKSQDLLLNKISALMEAGKNNIANEAIKIHQKHDAIEALKFIEKQEGECNYGSKTNDKGGEGTEGGRRDADGGDGEGFVSSVKSEV